eukprot:SAG31_NODE_197_length_20660_cov_8.861368_17_plen_131_part_00
MIGSAADAWMWTFAHRSHRSWHRSVWPNLRRDRGVETNTSALECKSPHMGLLCGACASGFRLRGHNCEQCVDLTHVARQDFGMSPFALAGVLTLVLAVVYAVFWALRGRLVSLLTELSTNLKIVSCHSTH